MFRIRITRSALLMLSALALLSTPACAPERGEPTASAPVVADSGPVVAQVNGRTVTLAELDEWIREDLYQQEVGSKAPAQQYELRSRALERMLDELVLSAEAERSGTTPDQVIAAEVAALGPVDDEEIAAFFERHRASFREQDTVELRGPQIRRFLEQERMNQAAQALRERADLRIDLEPPRSEVGSQGPSLGPEDAPITIVEFSDYQCPFCSRAEPIIKEVLQRYPEQVRLVYRHYPLEPMHPLARGAAEASICAEQQGSFWEYHALLFANQRALEPQDLTRYAAELELDAEAFAACQQDDAVKQRVEADLQEAQRAGARGTPAFFVNGILLSGAKPVAEFERVIERELAAEES